jgi:hypothetical protein
VGSADLRLSGDRWLVCDLKRPKHAVERHVRARYFRQRDRAQEPGRELRAHRGRGDVEEPSGGRLADRREQQIGLRARERAWDESTSPRSLLDYLAVIKSLLARTAVRAAA